MCCKNEKKTFYIVCIRGQAAFKDYGEVVPNLARKFFSRIEEVAQSIGTEIAIFEPQKDAEHHEGFFYVGVIVNEPLVEVPDGMDFITLSHTYVSLRGNMNNIEQLHKQLMNWSIEQGYVRDLESLIVETYHPLANGQEEVEIFLPIVS